MSYLVLVVPEDPTHNGDILEPLCARILEDCGSPNAKILVLTNPRVRGYEHAKDKLPEILDRYRHFDLALFLVDADGHDRSGTFQETEARARASGSKLICAAAVQEVEVWLLAGHVDRINLPWNEVRADVSVKENVFQPFLAHQYGDARRYGGGCDLRMKEAIVNYRRILNRCPELQVLRDRIAEYISD